MSENKRVLVTGAAGFIGARVCEILHGAGYATVRAGIHKWGSAARIGRLPIEITRCDLLRPEQLAAAMDGVDQVIHCAVGSAETNTTGTQNALTAALNARVKRFVHLSTIDVYGDATGVIDETAPCVKTGKEYGDTKIAAEEAVQEAATRGLAVSILRPTIVYGPFSALWTVGPAERMIAGRWFIADELAQGTCNLVYVDDLVQAAVRALESDAAVGEAFNVNGPDRPTWCQYFHALNNGMGLPPLRPATRTTSELSATVMMPVRKAAKMILANFEKPIMTVYQRSEIARKIMKGAEGAIRSTPTTQEFTLYSKVLDLPTTKAQEILGYRPSFDMAEGIRLSVAWLKHHRFLEMAHGHSN
ncbi:MAG: NAD(P)-dependent oxidoreductase [Myxococcota bacterium]|nr:NAD(P)-dependent oxidoreductase [Myxococcota bacterium]